MTERAKTDHAEWGLSHWVDKFLDRVLIGPSWHTAVETGTWMVTQSREARLNAENKRKARGIKPHHLDWYAYQLSTGIYAQWELKVEGRPTTDGQDDTIRLLMRNKIPTGVYETVPDVWMFLRDAGFLLHGNAENIALELHERYLANRREHAAPTKPKRAARARMAPRAGTVAQGHRLGLWKP